MKITERDIDKIAKDVETGGTYIIAVLVLLLFVGLLPLIAPCWIVGRIVRLFEKRAKETP